MGLFVLFFVKEEDYEVKWFLVRIVCLVFVGSRGKEGWEVFFGSSIFFLIVLRV